MLQLRSTPYVKMYTTLINILILVGIFKRIKYIIFMWVYQRYIVPLFNFNINHKKQTLPKNNIAKETSTNLSVKKRATSCHKFHHSKHNKFTLIPPLPSSYSGFLAKKKDISVKISFLSHNKQETTIFYISFPSFLSRSFT